MLTLLALGLYSLGRGSYPLPASTLARALLAPQEMGEQPRFILFDIRLPRILMALRCAGPCWGWPARRCRASPVTGWPTRG